MPKLSPRFVGNFAYIFSSVLIKTLRRTVYWHPKVDPKAQYIYAFWHDKQFSAIMRLPNFGGNKKVALVSASRDGEGLAIWLTKMGYEVVRGSSSRKSISSLVKLLDKIKQGYTVGVAADGPRGPRHEAKAGVAFLANKANLQIIPVGVAFSAKRIFQKSWDKYQLPYPFAKTIMYFGEPLSVPSLDNIEQINQQVTQLLKSADQTADLILHGTSQRQAEMSSRFSHPNPPLPTDHQTTSENS